MAAGESVSSESILAARGNRLGHHGLRIERLDRPWEDPVEPSQNPDASTNGDGLARAYGCVVHSRNRVYHPVLGRFMSDDPNGMGVPVLGDLAFNGMAIGPSDVTPSINSHFGDGMNTHVAYGGNPMAARDPLGLWGSWNEWWRDTKDGASLLWNGYQTFTSFTDLHGLIQGMAEELITEYSANLEYDVEWATDWNARDDAYTRLDNRWVNLALARGAYNHFNLGYWAETTGVNRDGPSMASDGLHSFVNGPARETAHHIGTIYGKIGKKIAAELRRAGLGPYYKNNIVKIFGHYGPHDPAYNE